MTLRWYTKIIFRSQRIVSLTEKALIEGYMVLLYGQGVFLSIFDQCEIKTTKHEYELKNNDIKSTQRFLLTNNK